MIHLDILVPLVLIFTKYDTLVTNAIRRASKQDLGTDKWSYGDKKASEAFAPLRETFLSAVNENVPVVDVSTSNLFLPL